MTTLISKTGLATLCLIVGLILHIVSFFSPSWYKGIGFNGGLWQICRNETGCSAPDDTLPGIFSGVQAAEIISAMSTLMCVGAVLWMLVQPSKYTIKICMSVSLFCGVVTLIAVLMFLFGVSHEKDWAAYLELSAAVLMIVGGLIYTLVFFPLNSEYTQVH